LPWFAGYDTSLFHEGLAIRQAAVDDLLLGKHSEMTFMRAAGR